MRFVDIADEGGGFSVPLFGFQGPAVAVGDGQLGHSVFDARIGSPGYGLSGCRIARPR